MLDSEEYARKAAEDIPENALGDSVFGKAAEDLITSTTNGEWKDAPSSILTSLEMEGADVSKLVEAISLAAEHSAERAAIAAAGEAGEIAPPPSCQAADPDLHKKFFRNTYNSSVRLILTDYYTRTRAELLAQVKALPSDAPERKALFDEIKDISSALLKLPARFKVVI